MTDTITINDPDLAKMFEESGAPSMSDIPGAINLGRTKDGQTRQDFEDEIEFEMEEIMVGIQFATIADVTAHLDHEGKKARTEYLRVLALSAIRDKALERAGGNPEAMFLETLSAHVANHGGQAPDAQSTPNAPASRQE